MSESQERLADVGNVYVAADKLRRLLFQLESEVPEEADCAHTFDELHAAVDEFDRYCREIDHEATLTREELTRLGELQRKRKRQIGALREKFDDLDGDPHG